MTRPRRYVARGVPGGWRIWNRKTRDWWGDHYEVCPDDLLEELNGQYRPDRITQFLSVYRRTRR